MSDTSMKLVWNESGKKLFETGVSNCALYVMNSGVYGEGVAWEGVTKVSEAPSGAEPTKLYAGNTVYATLMSKEEYGATIETYMFPDAFKACNGEDAVAKGVSIGQQGRAMFGMVYKTLIGSDTDGNDHGYKLHIVYGCKVKPSSKDHETVNDSPSASTMSFEIATTPVNVTGKMPTATLEIDSTTADATCLTKLEDKLFGAATEAPQLLTPDEIITIMTPAA